MGFGAPVENEVAATPRKFSSKLSVVRVGSPLISASLRVDARTSDCTVEPTMVKVMLQPQHNFNLRGRPSEVDIYLAHIGRFNKRFNVHDLPG